MDDMVLVHAKYRNKNNAGMSYYGVGNVDDTKLKYENIIVCDPKHELELIKKVSGEKTLIIGSSGGGHH